MTIRITLDGGAIPKKMTPGSAGYDLYAKLLSNIVIQPGETLPIHTGISLELSDDLCGMIKPRSGLFAQRQLTVFGGTIDSDYRGEIIVLMTNLGTSPRVIHDGDRIAQILFVKLAADELEVVDSLNKTERGTSGFGSTDVYESAFGILVDNPIILSDDR